MLLPTTKLAISNLSVSSPGSVFHLCSPKCDEIREDIEGWVQITLIVSCLEWFTFLFLFIMVEFEKALYGPDSKMVLIFLVTKVFQKGTMFK